MLNIKPGFTHITRDTIERLGEEKYNKFRKRFKQEFKTPDDFDDYGIYYTGSNCAAVVIDRNKTMSWTVSVEVGSRDLSYDEIIQFINGSEVTMLSKLHCGDIVYLANGSSGFVIQSHASEQPFLRIHNVDNASWYTVYGHYTDKLEYEPNSNFNIVKVERHREFGSDVQIYPVVEESPIEVIDRKIKKLRKKIAKLEEKKTNLL